MRMTTRLFEGRYVTSKDLDIYIKTGDVLASDDRI